MRGAAPGAQNPLGEGKRLSSERDEKPAYTQRELLALVLACAAGASASFTQARHAVGKAIGDPNPRPMTRELLSDLAIRNWIELRRRAGDGSETPVPRIHYELELANDVNWDEQAATGRARYALTEKGRERVAPMLDGLTGPRAEAAAEG